MVKHMTRNTLEEVKRELNLICGSDSDKYPVHILWRQNHCSIFTVEGTLQEVFSECTVWWKLLIVVLSVEFGWGLFCFLLTLSSTKSIAALPCEVEGAVMLSTVNAVPITKCVGELSVIYHHCETDTFNSYTWPKIQLILMVCQWLMALLGIISGPSQQIIKDYCYPINNHPCVPHSWFSSTLLCERWLLLWVR